MSKKYTFSHFAAKTSFNRVEIAVHVNKEGTKYFLVPVHMGTASIIKGGYPTIISIEDYENLPYDPYNSMVRFLAVARLCGVTFGLEEE